MKYPLLFAAALATFTTLPSQASEDFNPAQYHQSQCRVCHGSNVYTRSNRRVDSLPRLESQVRMCDANLGKKLFDDDILSLTKYLNKEYYHFDK